MSGRIGRIVRCHLDLDGHQLQGGAGILAGDHFSLDIGGRSLARYHRRIDRRDDHHSHEHRNQHLDKGKALVLLHMHPNRNGS